MKKSLALLIGATLLIGSAQAAPLAKSYSGNPDSPDLVRVSQLRDATTSLTPAVPVGGPFFVPQTSATIGRQKAARSAQAAANRAVADNVTLVAQSGANNFNLIPSFYIMPHQSTNSSADFVKFCQSGYPPCTYNGGGVYNPDNDTFSGLFFNPDNNTIMYFETVLNNCSVDMDKYYRTDLTEVGMVALAVTRDPISGKAYGSFYTDEGGMAVWGEVDYTTHTRTLIKDTSVPIVEVEGESYYDFNGAEAIYLTGVTRNGEYYGIRVDGTLVKIEKTTGEQTVIGQTNLPMLRFEGATACINQRNNTMIVSEVPADASCTNLWEISLETAEKTLIARYPAAFFYNMFMIPMPAAEKAPDAPTLTMSAPEGTMTVDYTITLPTTLFDGTPITGAVDWEISESGEVLFEGRNMVGSSVSGQLTISEPGMKTFVAQAKNAEGYSPKAVVEIYVGKGTPAAPATLTASYANGKMTLNWDAVTASADGGYIVPEEVTYDVADGNILLAADLTGTSYSFDMAYPDELTTYRYTVTAKYAGRRSAAMLSNELKIGPVALPYIVQLTSDENFANSNMTILDNNGDGTTWKCNGYNFGCNYNSSLDMDDWMFTPDVKIEAGKLYEVKIRTWCNGYTERIEVKYGNEATPEAMTEQAIPATIVNWRETGKQFLSGQILATENAIIHLGIHGCSDKDQYYLYIDEFQVSAGIPATAPAKPASIELTPHSTGALSCKVDVVAPTTNAIGETLSDNITINIKRNGETIETVSAAPGASLSYTDYDVPVKGTYTYSASAVNTDGEEGPAIEKGIYVGPYALIASKRCEFFETDMPGTVTVIWDAVDKDVNGNTVSSSFVTYMVYDAETMEEMLPARTSNLRATFKATADPNKQEFRQFVVAAFNRDQEPSTRNMKVSNYAPVGKAYSLPVKYTNAASFENYAMAVLIDDPSYTQTTFGLYDATSFEGITGQDDDTFFGFVHTKAMGDGQLLTGKIDLSNVERPELSFFLWRTDVNDRGRLTISVIADGEEKVLVNNMQTNTVPNNGWNKVRVNLEEYAGKYVQIRFKSTPYKTPYRPHLFDNMVIRDIPEVDLEMNAITAPKKVKAGNQFDINVELTNTGWGTAKDFVVNLYRDGKLIDYRDVPALDSEESINVVFENLIGYFDENASEAVYYAEAVCAKDPATDNNRSKDVRVLCPESKLPQVTDLNAEVVDEGVKLSWSAYQLPAEDEIATVNEDFEDCESFAQSISGWTFLDLDGRPLGQYDYPIPGVTVRETCASFLVMDQEEYHLSGFDAHSGYKYLASIYCVYGEDTHDWAISPLLSGQDDQTISFWARSATSFQAKFKVMATTVEGSINPDDYEVIAEGLSVSNTWTKFEYNIDLAYRHFAIVNISPAPSSLFIDDVTYDASALAIAPHLVGYDVYRNGVKIGETDGTAEFVDTEAPMGYHKYHVVARYAEGNSELSNLAEIEIDDAGIFNVAADEQPVVMVEGNDIVVSNAANCAVTISALDGKIMYSAVGDCRYTAAPAFYLVAVNNRAYKVVVH